MKNEELLSFKKEFLIILIYFNIQSLKTDLKDGVCVGILFCALNLNTVFWKESCHVKGENFLKLFMFDSSAGAPGKLRPLCLTSLSESQ